MSYDIFPPESDYSCGTLRTLTSPTRIENIRLKKVLNKTLLAFIIKRKVLFVHKVFRAFIIYNVRKRVCRIVKNRNKYLFGASRIVFRFPINKSKANGQTNTTHIIIMSACFNPFNILGYQDYGKSQMEFPRNT